MKAAVMVAMSGGVDSSVAAYLLKLEGYDVAGVTMCLGIANPPAGGKLCCSPQDMDDARRVCRYLDIPHYVLDYSEEFERIVIAYFINEYLSGRTPNPCVLCNRHLKFGTLLDTTRALGFKAMATGHYARIDDSGGSPILKRARDRIKDQSYFLYSIQQERLAHILFPLGDLNKEGVRDVARRAGIPVAEKKESQDVCFVTGGDTKSFFSSRGIQVKSGDIIDTNGNKVGTHDGIVQFTIGQRRGLGGGFEHPLYVIGINAEHNTLVVGGKDQLGSRGMVVDDINILFNYIPLTAQVKTRHASIEVPCRIERIGGVFNIYFKRPHEAVTPGQSAVFYHGDSVIAGGIIQRAIR